MYFKETVFSIPCSLVAVVLVSIGLVGCEPSGAPSSSGGSEAPSDASGSTTENAAAAASGSGKVAGVALFPTGDVPVMAPIEVKADVEFCGDKVHHENRIVNPANRGLKNVVVTVEGVQGGPPPELTELTMANKGCVFVPHVAAMVKGAKLRVTNEDPVLHTTHPYAGNRTVFNLPVSPGAELKPRPIRRPGVIKVKCDVHDWMIGWVVVHDTQYFAVSDTDGKFEIPDVPAGKYTVKAWHEDLGVLETEVEIKDGATSEAKFEFSPK